MEQKTRTGNTNNQFANLSSPFEEPPRRPLELEQVSVETNADEPIWLKIVYFLAGVYPILQENGKCKCNWKTVGWSILPFVWTCLWIMVIIINLSSPFYSSTFLRVWNVLSLSLILLLQLSLSYTRKRFSDAIVGEEYVNTVAKRGLMLSVFGGVIVGVLVGVNDGAFSGVIYGVVYGAIVGVNDGAIDGVILGVLFTLVLCQLAVIVLRCLFLAHTSVAQIKTELMEMAKGTEVEELQAKLLEISKMIQKALVNYLQIPLSLLFVFGMLQLVESGIRAYKNPDNSFSITVVLVFGTGMITPLWLLTRIEKFYLWTLRELLHRNTVMSRTEQTNLLAKYDTIAPRASIFGIYITRGRVASIIIAIFGSIAPKIGIYLYHNIGNPVNIPSGNHTVVANISQAS
jgi:hypothetical protein